jgi:transcriptional regulator with GAF, ATPase, and Fis domain
VSEPTVDDAASAAPLGSAPLPGAVWIAGAGVPRMRAAAMDRGRLVIGREGDLAVDDERVSREHAELRRSGGRFTVRDLGSKNGTFVDGVQTEGATPAAPGAIVRMGRSLVLLVADVRPFDRVREADMAGGELIVGPHLLAALGEVERTAMRGDTLALRGESGSGKELAARRYHAASGRGDGAFVALNCAAIPEGVAERVLFGAKKGAFSGAVADADGSIVAADKGTLFLDEIAELVPAVQAKLLRVLETREVLALGTTRTRAVDIRVVVATHRDLRAEVAAGRFREDLYFRVGRPAVVLPPLRERREEIPWLVARAVGAVREGLAVHTGLLEACCTRPWPGNVRELLAEARHAAGEAVARAAERVGVEHLSNEAGMPIMMAAGTPAEADAGEPVLDRAAIEAALSRCRANVSAAARELGLHRTQLYRLMKLHGIA